MRFATRLTLLLAILATALALLLSWTVSRVVEQSVEDRARERLEREAAVVSRSVLDAHRDNRPLDPIVRNFANDLGVRVTVVRHDGVVIADSEVATGNLTSLENHATRPEIAAARHRETGFAVRHSATIDRDLFYLARRASDGQHVIRLAIPYDELRYIESRYEWLARGAILVSCVLLFLVGSVAASRMSAPISRVSEAALAVAEGDLDRDPPSEGPREITELATALRRMKRSLLDALSRVEGERQLAANVFETLPDGTVVVDDEWRVVDANKRFRSMIGAVVRPGQSLADLLRDRELFAPFETAVTEGVVSRATVHRPGEVTWEVSVHPIRGTDRAAAVGIIHDSTAFRRNEAMRRQFVADVSHELRTPVTSMAAAAETLESLPPDHAEVPSLVRLIHRQTQRIGELIQDLAELSAIESGEIALAKNEVDLAAIASEVVEEFGPAAKERSMRIELSAAEGEAHVIGDERRIAQIVRNLLDNAMKFSADGNDIGVSVKSYGSGAILEVTDSGEGIPPQEIPRIFQRLYQVDRSRSKSKPGSGLGLAIVKHLAQLHRADVEVDSAVGRGSTFRVRFPRLARSAAQEVS